MGVVKMLTLDNLREGGYPLCKHFQNRLYSCHVQKGPTLDDVINEQPLIHSVDKNDVIQL